MILFHYLVRGKDEVKQDNPPDLWMLKVFLQARHYLHSGTKGDREGSCFSNGPSKPMSQGRDSLASPAGL